MAYKAGIIGAGGIAGLGILGLHDADEIGSKKVRASHAGGFAEAAGIELVAVADVDKSKLETFGEAWELPKDGLYADHEAMLRKEDLDVVSVCTPSFLHREHVLDAVEIGNPGLVWCEKPIASSVTEAEEMVAACEDHDTELLVNHSFRFTEPYVRLHEAMDNGFLGDVQSVTCQFRMELMRNATHVFDTLSYLLDTEPVRISGLVTGENEAVDSLDAGQRVDDAGGAALLELTDGTIASVDCAIPREESSMNFQIIGSEGKLSLNNDDDEWRYWRLADGGHVETDHEAVADGWTWEDDYESAFPNAARHVRDVLDGEAENRSPGKEAVTAIECIVGAFLSEHTGSWVELPLADPLRDVTITSW